jgi:hypothetical protein
MNVLKCKAVFAFSALLLLLAPHALLAQSGELNPYVGFSWPSNSSVGQLKDVSPYGLRAGYFLDQNVELEWQIGYINHFQVHEVGTKSNGVLWNSGLSYNFSTFEYPFSKKFTPYVVADLGGITTVSNGYTIVRHENIPLATGETLQTVRTITVRNRDTFFNFSYGAGFKSQNLIGPMGFRVDIRGRTIPNYYHGSPMILEASAGLTFIWGAPKAP